MLEDFKSWFKVDTIEHLIPLECIWFRQISSESKYLGS